MFKGLNNKGAVGAEEKSDAKPAEPVAKTTDLEALDKQLQADALKDWKKDKPLDREKKDWELKIEEQAGTVVEEAPKETKEESKEETKPEEKPEESKAAETEAKPEKAVEAEAKPEEAKEEPKAEVVTEEKAREYALKENLTVSEAKAELEGINGILKKYGGDISTAKPHEVELAKSYRRQQSAFDKLKSEAEGRGSAQAMPQIVRDTRGYVRSKIQANREKLVDSYRETYPAKSRDMEDEQILEDLEDRYTTQYESQLKEFDLKMRGEAATKRTEFLSSVPESAKKYMKEINGILRNIPDAQVLSPEFKFKTVVDLVRGQYIDDLTKEAEERGRRLATENTKILGEMPKPNTTTKAKPVVAAAKTALSAWEKNRALEMYEGTTMTEEEKYQEYQKTRKK
jgi:hypothetical protein